MSFIALCVLYLPARWPPNIALMSNRGGNFKFMTYADQFHALTQQDGTMTTPQLVLSLPDRRPEQHGLPLNPIRSSSPLAQSDFLWKSWFGALVIMREYFMNASPKFAALMQTQLIGLAKTLVIILHEMAGPMCLACCAQLGSSAQLLRWGIAFKNAIGSHLVSLYIINLFI